MRTASRARGSGLVIYLATWIIVPNEPAAGGVIQLRVGSPNPCATYGLVERSITGEDLLDELDRIAAGRSYPAVLGCDNGPELACQAMADWAGGRVGLSFIPPGEPWRNG